MNWRLLVIYSAVLGTLGGVFLFTQRGKKPRRGTDNPAGAAVLAQDAKKLTRVRVKYQGRPVYALRRRGKTWVMQPGGHGVDENQMASFTEAAEALVFRSTFPITPKRPARVFGLDKPKEWYDFTFEDGQHQRLWIGAQAPAPGNQYARLDKQPAAVVVAELDLFNLRQTDQQLRDKTILDLEQDDITGLDFTSLSPSVRTRWRKQASAPPLPWRTAEGLPLKPLEVDTTLGNLAGLSAMSFAPAGTRRPATADKLVLRLKNGQRHTLWAWFLQPGQLRMQKKGDPQVFQMAEQPWLAHLQKSPLIDTVLPLEEYDVLGVRFVGDKISVAASRETPNHPFVCTGGKTEAGCPALFSEILGHLARTPLRRLSVRARPGFSPRYRFVFLLKAPDGKKSLREYALSVSGQGGHARASLLGGVMGEPDDSLLPRLEVWQNRLLPKAN